MLIIEKLTARRSIWAALRYGVPALAVAIGACDSTPRTRDASLTTGAPVAEVAVRIDAPEGANPSASILAFRGHVSGGGANPDILSVVDPLSASGPLGVPGTSGCDRRDLTAPARSLSASGTHLELEAMTDVALDLGGALANGFSLRPTARVFPSLAQVGGGVVAEAGPIELSRWPSAPGEGFWALLGEGTQTVRERWAPPVLPRVVIVEAEGEAQTPEAPRSINQPLPLKVIGPVGTFVELRPFGATWALVCATAGHVDGSAALAISPVDLQHLRAQAGAVPVSLEAVFRENRNVTLGSGRARLTLEVRSSRVIEFLP